MALEYKTITKKIPTNSKESIDDTLNELGKDNWEIYHFHNEPYYDPAFTIGKYMMHTHTIYQLRLKRFINIDNQIL